MPYEFQGDVSAEASGQVADRLHAGLRRVGVRDIDRSVGAEGAGQVEARGNAVDGDDGTGAAGFGDGGGVEPQAAGALDGHAFAGSEFGPIEAGNDLRQGAVHTGNGRVRQSDRNAEHGVSRIQVVVLREGAAEMGPVAHAAQALALAVGAGVGVVAQADGAAAAGVEVTEDDAVAFTHRLSGRIRGDAGAQAEDLADALVAEGIGHFEAAADQVGVAAPVVQVRAADVGEVHLEDHGAGRRIGNRVAQEGEGLLDSVEYGHDTFRAVRGQAGASSNKRSPRCRRWAIWNVWPCDRTVGACAAR